MREGKPIYVVPLKIRCEDGEYSDGVDITAEGVYERLHRGELPRTSLPEGGVVSDTLDQIRADGYERMIAVMLSSGLSGAISGAVRAPHIINQSKCIKCGACMDHCRFDAIYKQ